jgi:DNA-binding MarR family transcriptional regulator
MALYEWLQSAAFAGELCPGNGDIADRFDLQTPGQGTEMIKALEGMGLIEVERLTAARVVTITKTGAKTQRPANAKPHWRLRPEHQNRQKRRSPTPRPAASGAAPAPNPVVAPATIADEVKAEAIAAGDARQKAKSTGTVVNVLDRPISPALRADHVEAIRGGDLAAARPNEVLVFIAAEWPGLWARVKALAAEMAIIPGEALFRAISAGVECIEEAERVDAPPPRQKEASA